jgi:hypothetical protein
VILAAMLTAALALGLAGSSTWLPGRHPLRRTPWAGPAIPPAGVITQARARQRRRHAKIAATAATIAAEAAGRGVDPGSPPPPGRRSRLDGRGPIPAPPPQAARLTGLSAASDPAPDGLSCPSAGACAVDGTYDGREGGEMFVANQAHGRWGKAQTVLGIPAANFNLTAAPVSCPSAGRCLAAGSYQSPSLRASEGFAVAQHNGTWGSAQQIPGLTSSPDTEIKALSCASAGNCAVGGSYATGARPKIFVPVVASEINGRWRPAQPIPGLSALPGIYPSDSQVSGISCAPAGSCTAVGTYTKKFPNNRAGHGVFMDSESFGRWGTAEPLYGVAARVMFPGVTQISCPSSGDCSLIGLNGLGGKRWGQAFVASQIAGIWGNSEPIPGLGGDYAVPGGLSCLAPGECTAAGDYVTVQGTGRPFTVAQIHGAWQEAHEIPGIPAQPLGITSFGAISCPSTGDCLVGGNVDLGATVNAPVAGTASETQGSWHAPREVPGIRALRPIGGWDATVGFISCPPGGPCASAGTYVLENNIDYAQDVFVVG